MTKYKYILTFPDGEEFDSMEEYGDDNCRGTFSSESEATDAALYGISCYEEGGEILHMSNPGDYPYDENSTDDVEFEVVEI
ncbi:hypothetical protein [Parafannyhessea umbonata]|uniref:hypothetical protein n=1 Tax=Parafannyhessea umbonata TaxID=604330 RepID=UPI00115FA561|nr:hypothetical protein [Parafannyhessea umbonata]